MALVDYDSDSSSINSGSDSDSEVKEFKKQKLHLPNLIKNYTPSVQIDEKPNDNPEEHEGRIRGFAHERGHWVSYGYIKVCLKIIEEIQQSILDAFQLESELNLKICKDIHLSLTKTIVLRHHWIDLLINSIKLKLKHFNEFLIEFNILEVYCNEERSRTFIALQTPQNSSQKLLKLTKVFDEVFEEYHLQKFYENPSFHISVLWCLGDKEQFIKKKIKSLQEIINKLYMKKASDFQDIIRFVYFKTGNKFYKFNINNK